MTSSDRNPLKEQVALLPLEPGVYQFLDRTGTVIYVGKAKSLRKRVSSYFMQNKEHPPKVRVLVRQIAEIRHIVVDSETDALLLENSLIKELQPRYNILLKDDKTYPWIVVRRENFPRIRIGVGAKPRPDYDLADWVLGKFPPDDAKALADRCPDIAAAAKLIMDGKLGLAQSKYNG